MTEKLITMPLREYEMIALDKEVLEHQLNELKQEKMVYVTISDPRTRLSHISQISGQIVDKDKLWSTLQKNLEKAKERETIYKERIKKLEEELHQASIKPMKTVVTKWWRKLF